MQGTTARCISVPIATARIQRPAAHIEQTFSWISIRGQCFALPRQGTRAMSSNPSPPCATTAPMEPNTSSANSADELIVQYIVLRKDLWADMNWPLGSIVAQGCHAATAALWLSKDSKVCEKYCSAENIDHMHKIVLEAPNEAHLQKLSEKLEAAGLKYKLWVEQPEDFQTCLATAPYPKSTLAPFFKKLKLCKG